MKSSLLTRVFGCGRKVIMLNCRVWLRWLRDGVSADVLGVGLFLTCSFMESRILRQLLRRRRRTPDWLPAKSRPPRRSVAVGTTSIVPSVVKRANLEVAHQVRQLLHSRSVGDL